MRYLSARQISEQYSFCMKTARILINEIRELVIEGRYPDDAVLSGCGVRVSEDVLIDLLKYRKALKDPVARQYVPVYWRVNFTREEK